MTGLLSTFLAVILFSSPLFAERGSVPVIGAPDDTMLPEPVVSSPSTNRGSNLPPMGQIVYKRKGGLTECPQMTEYVVVRANPKRVYEVCIDQYEYPNQKGQMPLTQVTWYRAQQLCEARGKYLCADREWLEACMGINNWDYGYYNVYDPEKCNVSSDSIRKSGDSPNCKTHHYEVYDLIGNVREWTSGGGVGASGGNYKNGRGARCTRWDALSLKEDYKDVGFRCCVKVFTGRYGRVNPAMLGTGQQKGIAIDTLGEEPPPAGTPASPLIIQ